MSNFQGRGSRGRLRWHVVRVCGVSLAAVALTGCLVPNGRLDEDSQAAGVWQRGLAQQRGGRPFKLSELLKRPAERVWFFSGYTPRSTIEKELGYAWDGAPDEVADDADVVVVDNGPGRVSGFTFTSPTGVYLGCVENRSYAPRDRFSLNGPYSGRGPNTYYMDALGVRCRK